MFYDGHYTFNYDELDSIQWKYNNLKWGGKECDNIQCLDIEDSNGHLDKATGKVHGYSLKKYNKKKKVIRQERLEDGSTVEVIDYQYKYKRYRYMMDKVWIPVSVNYLWQYSIEDATGEIKVFLGRDVEDYLEFKQRLSNVIRLNASCGKKSPVYAFTYVHNLSHEFNIFLMNLADKFSDVFLNSKSYSVFARDKRKPIYSKIKVNNVYWTYRCSYFLTNRSLRQWAKDESLPVQKEAPIDYQRILTPANDLDEQTLRYAIADVVVMQFGLEKFRTQYGSISNIPLTSTGKIRRILQKQAKMNPDYADLCYDLTTAYDFDMFMKLVHTYSGGWTHGNSYHVGKVIRQSEEYQLGGIDLASSYPACICIYSGFPMSRFKKVNPAMLSTLEQEDPEHPAHAWFMKIRLVNVTSKLNNTLWSLSKCLNENDINHDMSAVIDNGRIQHAPFLETYMTNLDWWTFTQAYDFDSYEVEELQVADAGYLPKPLVETVLKAYADKTSLKGLGPDYESRYKSAKEIANGIYGLMVFKMLSAIVSFKDNEWTSWFPTVENGGEDYFVEELEKIDKTTCHCVYQWGIWVTACARNLRLWKAILAMDERVIYCDTDSVKAMFNDADIQWVNDFNDFIKSESIKAASHFGFDPDLYSPKTKAGVPKPLGIFAIDSDDIDPKYINPSRPFEIYKSFKTLGAKRYAYEAVDGTMHTTIAGLPKKAGTKKCKKIEDFNDETFWNSDESGKLIISYGIQPEMDWTGYGGVSYHSTDRYSVNMKPTTFSMSMAPKFKAYIDLINNEVDEAFIDENRIMLL